MDFTKIVNLFTNSKFIQIRSNPYIFFRLSATNKIHKPKTFEEDTIIAVHTDNLIGQGGFGSVYKGHYLVKKILPGPTKRNLCFRY